MPDIPVIKNNKLALSMMAIAVLFAVAIQVQISIFQNEDYLGLRVNLADLLLPFTGIFVLITLFLKKTQWPVWRLKYFYLWLSVLSVVMTGALINGYLQNGSISSWALINKYTGWFVLLSYLALAGWLRTNVGTLVPYVFARGFIYAAILILFSFVLIGLINDSGLLSLWYVYPLEALMGNRNAYALLLLVLMVMISVPILLERSYISSWTAQFFYYLLPLAWLYNGSRAGFLCSFVLLILALVLRFRRTVKIILPSVCLGMIFSMSLFSMLDIQLLRESQLERTRVMYELKRSDQLDWQTVQENYWYGSEQVRLRVLSDAMMLWKEAPVQGAGLGSFLALSEEKYKEGALGELYVPGPGSTAADLWDNVIIDIIDCSLLWILTEMGLIGFLCFLAFYIAVVWVLWRDSRAPDNSYSDEQVFLKTILFVLMVFGMMSVLHELLYTRFIWLLMGLALSLTVTPDKKI